MLKYLGYDCGYSADKVAFFNDKNKIEMRKFINIVALTNELATDKPLLEGRRYYVGEDALMLEKEDIKDVMDYADLEKFSPLFMHRTFNELGIDSKNIKMMGTGLSLAQKEHMSSFYNRLSKVEIEVNGKKEEIKLDKKIAFLPQGVGAKYAIDYYCKEKGEEVPRNCLIIDPGFSTVDVVEVIGGEVRPDRVKGWVKEGTQSYGMVSVAQEIQKIIKEKFNEDIPVKEALSVLETKKFIFRGEHDLSKEVDAEMKKYKEILINLLENKHKRALDKSTRIFLVGGGSYLLENLTPVSEIMENAEYYNAIGNLLYAKQMGEKK